MTPYLVSYSDSTGEHKTVLFAISPYCAAAFVVRNSYYGNAIVNHVAEITELENGYKCYTRIF